MIIDYMVTFIYKFINRFYTKASNVSCNIIKPGIYKCSNGEKEQILALFTFVNSMHIEDLSNEDVVYILKKFLSSLYIQDCRVSIYTSLEPVDIEKYLSDLNRKLQMKLIELELDKANTKLRSDVERILETKRKILKNIPPISIENIVVLTCKTEREHIILDAIEKIPLTLKSTFGINTKPVTDISLASSIVNFCTTKTSTI